MRSLVSATGACSLALSLLILPLQFPRTAAGATTSLRTLLQTGPLFNCDLDATSACNFLGEGIGFTRGMVYADGYVFLMGSSGYMLRCLPDSDSRNTCITFNTIKDGGGPMAVLRTGTIIATSGNDMVRCSTMSANSCTLINQCAGGTAYGSLIVANNRIYAGLTNGILWSCDTDRADSCQTLDNFASPINTLMFNNGVLWAGVDNGAVMKCDPYTSNACTTWERAGSAIESMLISPAGDLFVGLGNGIMWKCPTGRADACATFNTVASNIRAMVQVQGQDTTIYIANDGGVFRCPTDVQDSCVIVAWSRFDMHQLATAVTGRGVILYGSWDEGGCPPNSACYADSAAYWMLLDDCPDRTVVSIEQAQITDTTNVPSDIKAANDTASFIGVATNEQNVQQTITYGLTITRSVAITVSWQQAAKNGWKVDVKDPLSIVTPLNPSTTAGYSGEVTVTDGKSTAVTNTVTTNALIQNVVPPHSNCSVRGAVTTSILSWSQEYDVTVRYRCGKTGQERWKADLTASDILTTSSQFSTIWAPCSIVPLPPITETCSSNPGCAWLGQGNCCPQDDGTYLACCAQAAAHMPTPCVQGKDFVFPNQTICPNIDWTYKTCCPQATTPPKSGVKGLRFMAAAAGSSSSSACGPNSYDAGMRVGAAGLRLCVDTAPLVGDRVPPGDAGKLVSNITVVAGKRAFAALRCPPGYSKHETDINGGASSSPRGPSMALCLKRAPAGTPVSRLVQILLLHPNCKQQRSAYTRLRGNLNSQAPGQGSAFVCLSWAAGGR